MSDMTQSYEQTPDREEQLDQDQLQSQTNLEERGVDDALDEGYSPPEKPSVLMREGEHDSLDARLSEEVPEPDPYAETDQEKGLDDGVSDESDFLDTETGDERAGRLMDTNEGIGPDDEGDLLAVDAGIDAGAASAEEAAMHIVPEDDER
ncbi:DUF5709 domain-containing protein [Microlunatus capsulatus]|uniref:DUF5709 domain-containing protein n=1 Tax=Microlunatus capsulatus TaxID=99117 RepID=A0ABS4Z4K7_9ACTN|nr:DUF5709 domain-containing protein [Microlunatus capsulatus]MBP2415981.1 hypothetical protein [Microlunatus capsulatus]